MHSRRPKFKPTINGKAVDLDLLYQIVTSHGGWEKVNTRNEWDDLLEHFHLPRGTNGGLVIKQIYLKHLENYEKIYFLGEDVGHHKDGNEDEYDDVSRRRRTASRITSRPSYIPSSASHQQQTPNQQANVPIPDGMREQLGLSTRTVSDYDRLLLSLQSPLPNEQDMAISICTLLSNETKHVLKFSKCPQVLNLLLAHAGIYEHCGIRMLLQETYKEARDMGFSEFWNEIAQHADTKPLLCESYVKRVQNTMGLTIEETTDQIVVSDEESEEPCDEEEFAAITAAPDEGLELESVDPLASQPPTPQPEPKPKPSSKSKILIKEEIDLQLVVADCCSLCPCNNNAAGCDKLSSSDEGDSVPPSLARSPASDDKVGQRVHQIAFLLRNLSFEEDNAVVMANNPNLLRYLLITANCSWGNLPQMSFDMLGNCAGHIKLQDPARDPLSSMLLSLVTTGLFSPDRFKVLRSLEAIRDLTKTERNEKILVEYMEKNVYKRLCELLTICDIMLLIYTLECILSITGTGEAVCNELVRVKGSVATLVSLVTVEAQSYGPKGCILMRVVETVTGGSQTTQGVCQQSGSSSTPPLSPPISGTPSSAKHSTATATPNSIQAIGLRTVSGHTVVPPEQRTGNLSYASSPPSFGDMSSVSCSPTFISQQQQFRSLSRLPNTPNTASASNAPPIQVQVLRPANAVSPSLPPILPAPPALTHVAQIQGKPAILPGINSLSFTSVLNPSTDLNSHDTAVPSLTTTSSNHAVIVSNHVQTKSIHPPTATTGSGASPSPVLGGLAQVSSHSLTQQVFTPCIGTESITEEAWATAWLKGGFESATGTSIEEGELYRMYCVARKKHPASLLSLDQLVQCVKLVYGATVGPVMKSFGSTSLSFIEGIRPKITLRAASGTVPHTAANSTPIINSTPVSSGTNGLSGNHSSSNNAASAGASPTSVQAPASMHIPSPLSPILKATLSRPPTPKSPTGERKFKTVKEKRNIRIPIKKKSKRETQPLNRHQGAKEMSPSSSAIRSLLASKVAQRQQKKLQQQQNKNSKNSKKGDKTKGNPAKMNGIDGGSEKGEESSASSSLNSIEEDSKTDPAQLTFQGLLSNGVGPTSKDEIMEVDEELDDLANAKVKGMLVNLLERKVSHKDPVNGLVQREIRISDKGLELIENEQSVVEETVTVSVSQEPQQMTFYASPQEAAPTQNCSNVEATANPSETILLSGGGKTQAPQVVKILEQPQLVENSTVCGTGGGGGGGGNSIANNIDIDTGSNCGSNGTGGGDFLEKFDMFSDLIVVNPEQLGLKRRVSQPNPENTEASDETPAKKPALCMNGNDDTPSQLAQQLTQSDPNPIPITTVGSVLQAALSQSSTHSTSTINSSNSTITAISSTNNQNQMVLPVRLAVNPQNAQQITFAGRQMVLQAGQQILLTGGSQPGIQGLQGQVLISKTGGGGDSMGKTIILIPATNQQAAQSIPVGQSQLPHPIASPNPNTVQMILSQMPNKRDGVSPSALSHIPVEALEQELPYLCEWAGCLFRFQTHQQVFMHAINAHCPDTNSVESVRCEWGANGCDPLVRKRYSLMTHLQDRHCNKQALELACYRRKNKIEPPPPPQQPVYHPGYAPNAAFHAIKRHALQYMNPKEVMDENEGPVTKSIRLTSSLILRNLVNFSPLGRRMVGAYESQLSAIVMSNVESSRTLAQLLHDMSESVPS